MKDNNQPADERCQQCGGFLTVPKDSTDAARILCGGLMLEEKKANLRSSLERIRLAESFPVENGDFVEKSSSGWLSSRKVSTGKEGERHDQLERENAELKAAYIERAQEVDRLQSQNAELKARLEAVMNPNN